MAGDWIKIRVNLADDPAVIGICEATGLDEYGVIGRLCRLWSWADQQLTDGNAPSVTQKWIDRYVHHAGFAQAMLSTGWLEPLERGVRFPHWDRHNGKPAKKRALAADRQETFRGKNRNASGVTDALPEKRREEITTSAGTNRPVDNSAGGAPASGKKVSQNGKSNSRHLPHGWRRDPDKAMAAHVALTGKPAPIGWALAQVVDAVDKAAAEQSRQNAAQVKH